MNSLEEIILAVKELTLLIRTAYTAGFREYSRPDGERVVIRRAVQEDALIVETSNKKFTLDNLETVVRNFRLVYETAMKAYEYLTKEVEVLKKATETLAPFVLQEELSK